uniref:ENDD1 protein n=1 Tax=Malurus cyaneus samueli TaxID=2593467 RepID=A0A8C5TJN6_9PASS
MLWLLLLQVLASCLWLGHSEVVTDFTSCPQFFYEGITPNEAFAPNNSAKICQRYNDQYHFATLYDRTNRIPVYSAYIYQPGHGPPPHPWFFVEPQLIGKTDLTEMKRESVLIAEHKFTLEQIKESQAVVEDYDGLISLVRGHLSPSGHQTTKDSKMATFTLTNIVPQDGTSEGCTTTYVITGAVPGDIYIAGGRVNKPSHIWSAACCVMGEGSLKAWAAIAKNDENQVRPVTLGELEDRLTELYGQKRVTLFDNACPRQ